MSYRLLKIIENNIIFKITQYDEPHGYLSILSSNYSSVIDMNKECFQTNWFNSNLNKYIMQICFLFVVFLFKFILSRFYF